MKNENMTTVASRQRLSLGIIVYYCITGASADFVYTVYSVYSARCSSAYIYYIYYTARLLVHHIIY